MSFKFPEIRFQIKWVFWALYFGLLAVLVPHMSWAAEQWEPAGGKLAALAYAIVFEGMIAALTYELSRHIESMPKIIYTRKAKFHPALKWFPVFAYRYLNIFSLGLVGFTGISMLGNLAHAVEFGQQLKIFGQWNISFGLYAAAFGGALPLANLFFARILSNVTDDEDATNPELEAAKAENKDLRRQVKDAEGREQQTEARLRQTEHALSESEARFQAAGDLMRLLFSPEKRDRIIAAKRQWPQLTGAAIALMTDSKPSHVSEVLKEMETVS